MPDKGCSGSRAEAVHGSASLMVTQCAKPNEKWTVQCGEVLRQRYTWERVPPRSLSTTGGIRPQSCGRVLDSMDTPYGNESMATQSYDTFQYPSMWQDLLL